MISQAFNAVLPSFVMIFVGYIYGRIFKDKDINIVNDIATWLMAPLVTFTFTNDYVPSIDVLLKFGGGFAILFVVSFLISRLHKKDRELFFTGNVYVNSGYLGYPVLLALWGEEALALGVVYSFVNVLFGSTFLPAMIRGRFEWKNVVKLPFIYAIAAGWILGLMGISYKALPTGILTGFNWLRDMAIPFLLLQVGLSISKISFEKSDLAHYLILCAERLVLIPLIMVAFSLILKPFEAKVFILESAMPIGVNSVVVINTFKKEDTPKAGVTVALSTLL
ncbi:MAG TPA: AEC family transporter, partial [Fervidobacterium sp.]|nr:AEC family transporter [Fervidobacterium sp.]HOL03371.1 AEC family transporter [Fervidobacterium sp.]HQG02038.1 AEC family transporter [Fervidobacterium sp.]